jgi:hypothetical protein
MFGWRVRLVAAVAVSFGLSCLVSAAQGRSAASLALEVSFSYTGAVSVTLPDGTPVGTTSGAPTLIPAGFYTVSVSQPGCMDVPYFELDGPGVDILDNMDGGELVNDSHEVEFQPDSSYSWSTDATPGVSYMFVTSADVEGTPPASSPSPAPASSSGRPVSNSDPVGSAVVPFRGTLAGAVSAAGRLTLAYQGKSVTRLPSGRYKINVVDASAHRGFTLQENKHAPVGVTGAAFVGKASVTVNLTPGQWFFTAGPSQVAYRFAVS